MRRTWVLLVAACAVAASACSAPTPRPTSAAPTSPSPSATSTAATSSGTPTAAGSPSSSASAADQTLWGCVVAYNTYASTPPRISLFGRTVNGRTVVCVNPGDPAGGVRRLDPIVPVPSRPGAVDVVGFVSYPGAVSARCRSNATSTWLEARPVRASQLPERALEGQLSPAWGLHRVDITVALGDLIDLAAAQADALAP